jgi:hypothetical protein
MSTGPRTVLRYLILDSSRLDGCKNGIELVVSDAQAEVVETTDLEQGSMELSSN